MSDWFVSWFNSPYYHVLYRHRNNQEAAQFIDTLLAWLQPAPHSRMLDVACGKGRHSWYLCQKGHSVTGIDLSSGNIEAAQQIKCNHLHFFVHDMRQPFAREAFDYAFNFFTSFGYFSSDEDNQHAVETMAQAVVPGGTVVIDFLNADKVIAQLTPHEIHHIDGVDFRIEREYVDGCIRKHIHVMDQGHSYQYMEEVQALRLTDFIRYFEAAGLVVTHTFGNYQLEPFHPEQSERLIIVGKRPQP